MKQLLLRQVVLSYRLTFAFLWLDLIRYHLASGREESIEAGTPTQAGQRAFLCLVILPLIVIIFRIDHVFLGNSLALPLPLVKETGLDLTSMVHFLFELTQYDKRLHLKIAQWTFPLNPLRCYTHKSKKEEFFQTKISRKPCVI